MSTIVSPPAGSTATNIDGLINHLRRENPTAKITSDTAAGTQQQVHMVVLAPDLKLIPSLLVDSFVEDLTTTFNGPYAVVTFTVNALPS